jgi:beta-N-acetylhexosaminidase
LAHLLFKKPPQKFKNFFCSLPELQQAGFFLWPSLAGGKPTVQEKRLFQKIKPSGCVLFKRNLLSFQQSRSLVSRLKALCSRPQDAYQMPCVVAIDEEGGRVSRLPPPFPRGKPAFEFSQNQDLEGLQSQVLLQAFTAKGLGINCLLSPVADILTEPSNVAIGDRSFGTLASTVAKYACVVNRILLEEGLFSCAKHFPGHGNTTTDTHQELSVSEVGLKELRQREWLPFRRLIQEGVSFVMAAHVKLPLLDAQNPASLSPFLLGKKLRKDLKFKGLILSDDLRMNAIAQHFRQKKAFEISVTEGQLNAFLGSEEEDAYLCFAALEALEAGCDIILSCQSIVSEENIARSIARKMREDKMFQKKMVEKAWNIFLCLTKKIKKDNF